MSFRILIQEECRKLPVSRQKLEEIARVTFQLTWKEQGDISLVVGDDDLVTKLNEQYTKRRGPTDVLAFSMREGEEFPEQNSMLGDIVISYDTAMRQAQELGESLEDEFIILFVHGLLHLLGFDHRNRREESTMQKYTQKILTGVK